MTVSGTSIWPESGNSSLEVHSLGIVDLPSLIALQDRIAFEISGRDDRSGTVLLYEYPPVVSVGREGSYTDFLIDREQLEQNLIDIHWLPRGGSSQVHVPGQLCVSVIAPLDRLQIDVLDYRTRLEDVAQRVCKDMHVTTQVRKSRLVARTGQVGAVGLLVKSDVTYYGLTINVQPNLDLIRLCHTGGEESRHSSLSADTMKHTPMSGVRESLARHLTDSLGYESRHWYTGHPLLVRTKKKVHVYS
ncbi:MAG: hypothetical protein P8M30_09185 [Planctomycetaceae bacterium]|jgi:lipoyl(octanoyl) transferase|nr:hypothetical protein [Planctomycetaceae bacterium]